MRSLRIFVFLVSIYALVFTAYNHFYNGPQSMTWIYIISMDGRGYYGYLPALLIHNDSSFKFHE